MGLSSFASKAVEEVAAANPQTFFQMYWSGTREEMLQRLARARAAGAVGLIVTLDWSFSHGRDWGSPAIPEKMDLQGHGSFAPEALPRPRWLSEFARSAGVPDLTAPNLAAPGSPAPTFFGAYGEWMQTPPAHVGRRAHGCASQWDGPFMLKGVMRVDDARRAVDAGVTAISVSNHGGNNLDGTPAPIRAAARHRRGCRRRGRSPPRRRHPPRQRRRQGTRARRPRGHDRPRLPVGPCRQRASRRRERPRHPAQRHRLRRSRLGAQLNSSTQPPGSL